MKHIAITGAFGLVGTNLCRSLPKFLTDYELTKIKCDDIPKNLASQDIIIHGAGYGQPLKFTADKIRTIEINTKTTIELFKYLKPNGKFLYVSTSEVYSGADTPYKEEVMGTTTPAHPRACYIEGKRCGEAIVHSFKEQGFDVKIARLSLAYGPAKLGDTRVLNQLIEQGLTGHIKLRDSGTAMRTYCYVQDAADLIWKILLYGKDVVYNVGGFSTVTIAELAQEIATKMNATLTIPPQSNSLQGAPENVCLDMTHTLTEFDQHFTSLDRGLTDTINAYRK